MDVSVRVTYLRQSGAWQAWLSSGQRLVGGSDLAGARAAVARAGPAFAPAVEYVQVPEIEGVEWGGLRFLVAAPTFDIDAPTEEQQARLQDCVGYYRDRLPEGMRLEMYANRIRIEPGAFGRRGQIIDAVGSALARQVPDEVDVQVAPSAGGLDRAREQFARAKAIAVPDGFVRVVYEVTGFEADGDLGVIYLVLRDRWDLDRPN